MSRILIIFQFIAVCFAEQDPHEISHHLAIPTEKRLSTISFGSCNHQKARQTLWETISKNAPDLFIWLGDNVYADTDDSVTMHKAYVTQKMKPSYAKFISQTPVVGIWDDHDYGKNDGGKEWHFKKESKGLLLDFLDVPESAEVRQREGAYQSYTFGTEKKKVKIILLDCRYFRDPIDHKKPSGDILGSAQWEWLEKEVSSPDISLYIIGSGIQVLPVDHRFEKWNNFPQARERLLKTLPSNSILISGDRHIGEISQVEVDEKTLTEVTSSGLTHAYRKLKKEENRYRKGSFVNQNNFGLILINWDEKKATLQIKGQENKALEEVIVHF